MIVADAESDAERAPARRARPEEDERRAEDEARPQCEEDRA